ncbi:hypothetical protein TL16_g03044 [Triparma laevis f. inornata]|uniref:Uncharacterized protein n=2 Tax=Triparma laevis TaxID=1534972 RepID=A0A9W7FUT1_9STRA|nr:hypothetical protein TL16_g03044 [Triparma laevis f. inornata]GMI18525.1 hypothetical protein TrLO_g14879 [Triparma laevis f. longispina]
MTPDSMIDLMTKLKVPPATKNKSGDKSGAATSTTTKVQTSSSSSTSSVTSSYSTRTPSTPLAPSNSTITPNNTPSNASKPAPIPSPLLSLTSPSSIRGSPHLSTPTQLLDFTNNTNSSPFSPSQTLKTQSTEKPRKYTYARDSPQSSTGSSKHSTPLPPVNPLSSNIQTGLPSSSPLQPPPASLNPTLLTKLGPNGPRIQVLCDVYRSGGCEREKFVIIINEWAGGMAGEVLRDQRVF